MGHTRLGEVPKTHKWSELVDRISGSGRTGNVATADVSIGVIAAQTLDATQKSLKRAATDPGVRYTFYLITQVALAARVNIRFENVTRALHQHLPARLVDFLEIASYVFTADCATERGEQWTDDDSREAWGRDFAFVVPVRDPAFWTKPEITSLIKESLSYLSNDKYSFTFVPLTQDRSEQRYFEFAERKTWSFHAPERVVMFSRGLDSLAGAVETANKGDHVVLVSHRSVSTVSAHQKKLFHALQKRFPIGPPWPKKIQDEKTRAGARMKRYSDSVFAEALILHLPKEFDDIAMLINSRNSQHASKTSSA